MDAPGLCSRDVRPAVSSKARAAQPACLGHLPKRDTKAFFRCMEDSFYTTLETFYCSLQSKLFYFCRQSHWEELICKM